MNSNIGSLIDNFSDIDVLVVGEAILDSYLQGPSERLCREAPVPIVDVSERTDAPGGAANTAVNVRSLGGRVTLLSIIGDDQEGGRLQQALLRRDVPTEHLIVNPWRRTLAKHRVVAESQLTVRFDQGDTEPVNGDTEEQLLDRLTLLFPRHDAVVISDYGYGIFTPRVITRIAELQAGSTRLIVADSKRLGSYRDVNVTAVKPNYAEAIRLLGLDPMDRSDERVDQVAGHEDELFAATGAEIVAVTLDTAGALIFERGRPAYRTYSRPQPHSRAAGAGDTFVSALTLALTAGAHTPAAAELASAAAGVVVDKEGTNACSLEALQGYVTAGEIYIEDWDELRAQLALYRQQGRRIVFTNGCFDIMHRGHITYLNRAKALGNVLIVGLNADDSVRRLKGSRRPINMLEDRAQVLSALSCIDHIVPFEEDTPRRLIELVKPDVFVKGGDYTRETLPEAALVEELGGVVQILPYVEDVSTTSIIDRIREAYAQPAGNGHLMVPQVGN